MNHRLSRRTFLSLSAAWAGSRLLPSNALAAKSPYNILFIAADDLTQRLGAYGDTAAKTPHLDQLAREGMLFTRGYCQFPRCWGSRCSILSGARPTDKRFRKHHQLIKNDLPNALSLPGVFKQAGYYTASIGKVAHSPRDLLDDYDKVFHPKRSVSLDSYLQVDEQSSGPVIDRQLARVCSRELQRLAKAKRPFFLGVGFRLPHMPITVPHSFWQLHENSSFPKPTSNSIPRNAPANYRIADTEIMRFKDVSDDGPTTEQQQAFLRGWYAAHSFVDQQVGTVLEALRANRLDQTTIVVFWSDHGFSLGNHGHWGKGQGYQDNILVPLIIKVPGLTAGVQIRGITELVDLYPTLCELCELQPPTDQLEGASFAPLLRNPQDTWKKAAFTETAWAQIVSTANHSYWRFRTRHEGRFPEMLFDLNKDPGETVNVANTPEKQQTLSEMRALLDGSWQSGLPAG